MRFGVVPIDDACDAMLAHSMTAGGRRFRKAHRLTADDIALLKSAGVADVVAAVLSPEDVDEDAAATAIAAEMRFSGILTKPAATGRVNFHAEHAGVFTVDKLLVDRLNAIHPAITLATVAAFKPVEKNELIATLKIIPFAVHGSLVDRAVSLLRGPEIFSVHRYRPMSVGLVQTVLPGLKDSILAKTARVITGRLERSGSVIGAEVRTSHEAIDLAEALAKLATAHDMVIAFGASALCDFDDVIPAAIRLAGGEVLRAGMPVDPGNLLVLGRIGEKPIIGAPGCARSPKENGFDWILDRLVARIDVTAGDIGGMGVGGLLMEIPGRPQPREAVRPPASVKVHAIVLAAGRSSRMEGANKLMAHFSGQSLIRQTASRALGSRADGVLVVTGHQAQRIGEALEGLDIEIVHNPDFASGLSTSLKAGLAALPLDVAGALVMLGDMPAVSTHDLDRLVAEFHRSGGRSVVRAAHKGKRGNPLILPRSLFSAVAQLEGDIGARHLVEAQLAPVVDVEMGKGASIDVDTREALERAGGVLQD